MISKYLLLSSFVFACSSVAYAGEPADWSGFYVGGSVASSKMSFESTALSVETGSVGIGAGGADYAQSLKDMMSENSRDSDRATGFGIYGGYLWQADRFAYGMEIDYIPQHSFSTGEKRSIPDSKGTTWVYNRKSDFDVENLFNVRGRIGYVQDDWGIFVFGGVAHGTVRELSRTSGDVLGPHYLQFPEVTSDSSEARTGYSLGVGGEYRLTERLRLRADLSYLDLGNVNYSIAKRTEYSTGSAGAVGSTFVYGNEVGTHSLNATMVRVGLTYAF